MSFDFLKDILPSLITLIVAVATASLGLRNWRKQEIEKEKREFAKEFLKNLYKLTDSIKDIRHWVSYSYEGSTRKRNENESDFISKALDRAFIPFERYYRHKPSIDQFRALKYEYFILFNKDDENLFLEIEHIFTRILVSAEQLGKQYWCVDTRVQELDEVLVPQQKVHEKNIWDLGKDDEINVQLKKIVGKFESACYQAIKNK